MYTPRNGVVARSALFALSVLVSAGCATTSPSLRWGGNLTDAEILVEVDNLVWNDVTIYSSVRGSRARLGMVTTGATGHFRIPRHHRDAQDLELIADPIGSPYVMRSGRIQVGAGQTIRWTVHENAAIRSLIIW